MKSIENLNFESKTEDIVEDIEKKVGSIENYALSLFNFRQKSITDFMLAGGVKKTASFPLKAKLFTSDPQLIEYSGALCHPKLKEIRRFCRTFRNMNNAQLCVDNLKTVYDKFGFGREAAGSKADVAAIRFDLHGVLFAVVSSNGIVRTFDFDEVLGRIQSK